MTQPAKRLTTVYAILGLLAVFLPTLGWSAHEMYCASTNACGADDVKGSIRPVGTMEYARAQAAVRKQG